MRKDYKINSHNSTVYGYPGRDYDWSKFDWNRIEWNMAELGRRFNLSRQAIRKILSEASDGIL